MRLAEGVHPMIAAKRLEHGDFMMMPNRYSHVTADMQRHAADLLDAAFREVS